MNGLAQAQRKHDRQEPADMTAFLRKDEIEFNAETHVSRFPSSNVTDEQVERFIADLVAAPNRDIFLENNLGALPRSASHEYPLHIAVAEQWVKNIEAVGETIGPVFWQWAKNTTHAAVRFGWHPSQAQ